MESEYKYNKRGVSAKKEDVHEAIKNLDKGLYERAFCKILPDITGGDDDFCNIMHADTAGTKTALAYLYWKETHHTDVWKNIAQDAIVMNLDDMACVGCVDDIILSSTIGRNKHLIPAEVIAAVINGCVEFIENMSQKGIHIHLAGGETADVGDIVRTIDVGYTAFCRMKRSELIVNHIQAGDVIVGLASYGQAEYESAYNSGIGSNGLTSARHDVLGAYYYDHFPESFDPNTPREVVYTGNKRLTEVYKDNQHLIEVGHLLLSPTRTYLPVVKSILETVDKKSIHGMIHCTGGGQTKVIKFLENKKVIKDNFLPIPTVFRMIQEETNTSWKEMFQVFNMGHRLEFYVPEAIADTIIQIARQFAIEAQIIGRVEDAPTNQVLIDGPFGRFEYDS